MNSIDNVQPVAWLYTYPEIEGAYACTTSRVTELHPDLVETPLYTHPPTSPDAQELVEALRLVKKGMENGYIKSAPYMDFDPNAKNLEMKHPLQTINAALAKWRD